jgi:hypothetical protein
MSRQVNKRKEIRERKKEIIKGNGREVYFRYKVYITGVAKV